MASCGHLKGGQLGRLAAFGVAVEANDAYMLIACLAWNLKAWMAQLWPDRKEGEALRRMEYRRFIASVIAIPCQVVKTGRRVVIRALSYSEWLAPLRAHDRLREVHFA